MDIVYAASGIFGITVKSSDPTAAEGFAVDNAVGMKTVKDGMDIGAVSKNKYKVTAVYTDTEGKGPVPENIDITEDSEITVDSSAVSVNGSEIDFSGLTAFTSLTIGASYEAEAGELTSSASLNVFRAAANIRYVDEYNHQAIALNKDLLSAEIYLKGVYTINGFAAYFDIPDSLLPEDYAEIIISDNEDYIAAALIEGSECSYKLDLVVLPSDNIVGTYIPETIDGLAAPKSSNVSLFVK